MPIDPSKALAAEFPSQRAEWGPDDIILYHLGLGAGFEKPTDAKELEYTYEQHLKVLPSYGVIPVFGALSGLGGMPGVEINFAMVLHGEQDLVIHRPIPVSGSVETKRRVAAIWDKGKAALIVMETVSSDKDGPLFTNRFGIFARGEGGFGGESGPPAGNKGPERDPDVTVESKTMPNQALIYRLSGDKNPLHADPQFAQMGGFNKPILHGLSSFGVVCKAVVDNVLEGDVTEVERYQVRFAGVVFPGETIVTLVWREGDRLLVAAKTKERDTPVVSNAAIELRS
ncbi:MAG: MaoC/PaaZ C-terminal domain-containing protein [Gemmatimonadota bacterium]|nr:MaoC/PaaZ C-terminal domain-containing protein [Gemmatimonadota bacterium]